MTTTMMDYGKPEITSECSQFTQTCVPILYLLLYIGAIRAAHPAPPQYIAALK